MKVHPMKRCFVHASLVCAVLAAAPRVHADTPQDDATERARTFFNAGAQAYGAAKYLSLIHI